jgi:hypothetical protein
MPDSPVLTVDQVAALLRCTASTVRDRALALGGLKIGRDWVFQATTFYAVLNELASQSVAVAKTPADKPSAVLQAVPKRTPPELPR